MRRIVWLSLAFAAIAPLGCHHEAHEAPERGKFTVTKPLRKSVELTKSYVAQIRAHQHIELRALEHGYLQEIFGDEGQKVSAGKRMFQLLPVVYQAEVLPSC